jgi:formamidopyrimidine-DNA glycosylase
MLIHLRISGQVYIEPAGAPELKHTHVRLDFTDGDQLRFVDPRTFGEVFACESSQLFHRVPSLAELGWDPLASPISLYRFRRQLAGRRRETKAFLLDQRNIAGLGNIYTDEVLFDARVRYDARTSDLTPHQAGRLYRAILRIPADAAAAGGSSLRDEQYRRLSGELGRYQDHHTVYGREGEPCVRCGRAIRRAPYGGRSTFFCPRCQK